MYLYFFKPPHPHFLFEISGMMIGCQFLWRCKYTIISSTVTRPIKTLAHNHSVQNTSGTTQDPLLPSSWVLVCLIRTDREQPNNNNTPWWIQQQENSAPVSGSIPWSLLLPCCNTASALPWPLVSQSGGQC